MESVTKTSLDSKTIERLVEKHFPDSRIEEVKELKGGMFNSAYFVKGEGVLKDGVVLKVGVTPETEILTYEKDIIQTEVSVYEMLQGKDIPLPKILAVDFSRELINSGYFFMSYLPGKAWHDVRKKISKENHKEMMEKFGSYNAQVHTVKGEWFGYIKNDAHYQFNTWSEAFCGMMEDIMKDGSERKCKLPYEEIRKVLTKYKAVLDEVKEPVLVDFDMWPGNVFVREENGRYDFTGIVDFERSFFGDPYADFTSAVMLFDDVEQEPEFIRGYEKVTGKKLLISENDRIRMNLYRLYMAIIMHVETYRFRDNKAYASGIKMYTSGQIKKLLKKL